MLSYLYASLFSNTESLTVMVTCPWYHESSTFSGILGLKITEGVNDPLDPTS